MYRPVSIDHPRGELLRGPTLFVAVNRALSMVRRRQQKTRVEFEFCARALTAFGRVLLYDFATVRSRSLILPKWSILRISLTILEHSP